MSEMALSDVRGSRGLWSGAAARIKQNRVAVIAASVIVALAILALSGPAFSRYTYDALDWQHLAAAPSATASHWLGTDRLGRDLLVRTLCGIRISLLISLMATAISLAIGVAWGSMAGYIGGRTDEIMMRFVDVLYSLPYLFIVIILMTVFQRGSLPVLFCAIGAVGWLTMARIVRGQTLALNRREFIEAARAGGLGTPAILLRHIIPNLIGPIVVYTTLTIPIYILGEAGLSFLGVGVTYPTASWGQMLSDAGNYFQIDPFYLIVPGITIFIAVLSFNLFGDGLRDALDPKSTR